MALILSIDTSTSVCSAAISANAYVLACAENNIDRSHAAKLNTLIADACREAGKSLRDIDAIAISRGPGSYTGLRIGVSTTKGICYALNIPLIAVDTLKTIATMLLGKYSSEIHSDALIVPMIEARRDEVFSAVFDCKLNCVRTTAAEILNNESFSEFKNKQLVFCGNGSIKAPGLLKNTSFSYFDDVYSSAAYMSNEALAKFGAGQLEDVAYFEPYYLKDFVATVPKNKVLGNIGETDRTRM